MEYIDYGLLILRRDAVLKEIPEHAKADLALFLNKLSAAGELRAHEVRERFYEIGSPHGLDDFEVYIRRSG
jgi:hypothetical protein